MVGAEAAHGPSVRRQLLRPLLWVWLLGMAAAVGGAYWLARASVNAAFDRSLQDECTALASRVKQPNNSARPPANSAVAVSGSRIWTIGRWCCSM